MSAIKWLSNVGKSVAYSAVDVVKDMNPVITSFAETNKEAGQIAYKAIIDWKGTTKTAVKSIKENEYVEMGSGALKNAWADLKTGQLYNRERQKQAEEQAMRNFLGDDANPFGDFDDSFDDDDDSSSFSGMDEGDEFLAGTMDEVGEKTSTAISTAILRSSEAQLDTRAKIFARERVDKSIMYGGIRSDLSAINSNLANLVKFDSEVMQVHAKNSTDFYSNATGLLTETRDLLKELVDSQKTPQKQSKGYESKLSDIFDSEGNIDIKGFLGYAKDKIGGGSLDMIKMYKDMGMFDTMLASPLQFVTKAGVEALIAPALKKSMKNLNDSISGAFSSLMLNAKEWQGDGNIFKNFFGNIFGLDETVKTGINVGGYEKGKVAWTGIDHKALTEVIPTLLSNINATLGGVDKRFNYETGKFVSVKTIKGEYNKMFSSAGQSAASDIYFDYLNPAMEKMKFSTKKDEEQFRNAINKILETNFRNMTAFNPNKKHNASEFGINVGSEKENEALMRKIEEMWAKSVSGSAQLKYSRDLVDELQFFNSNMHRLEQQGSIYNQLFNDSDLQGTHPTTVAANAAAGANAKYAVKNAKKKARGRNKNNSAIEIIAESDNKSSAMDDSINSAVLERLKVDHPEYFKENGKLKDNYYIKNGKIERKKVKLSTGIELLDDTISNITEESKSKKERFQKMLNDDQSDITRYINKISESIYNVFFPKEEEDLDEQGMTFAQKISHSIAKYMSDEREHYLDRADYFRDKLTTAKDFINKYFGTGVQGLKDGFKDLWSWIKGEGEKAAEYAGVKVTSTKEEKTNNKAASQILKDLNAADKEDYTLKDAADSIMEELGQDITGFKKKNRKGKKNSGNMKTAPNSILNKLEGSHAALGTVKKTGLAIVHEGEEVVSKDKSAKDTAKRIKDEHRLAKKLVSNKANADDRIYGDAWNTFVGNRNWSLLKDVIHNDSGFAKWVNKDKNRVEIIKQLKDDTSTFGQKILNEGINAFNYAKNQANDILGHSELQISADDKEAFMGKVNSVMDEIKGNFPHFITGAALGGGVSLLTGAIGGPLLGAAAGAGIGLLTSSERIQNMLFGEQDENGERQGGLLSKNLSNIITKYAPSMAGGATLGAITSILPFVPGGPVAGIIVGSSLGFLSKSEKAQETLFGIFSDDDEDPAKTKERFQKKVKSVLPKMGFGAIAGAAGGIMFGGPFGLATNAILGASLGFLSDTDKFRNAILGEKGEDGKYTGGVVGAVKDALIEPMKNLIDPIQTQLKVMFKDITRTVKGMIGGIGKRIRNRLKGTGLGKFFDKIGNLGKNILTAPFKLVGGAAQFTGDKLRAHQLKKGTAVYWNDNTTALERIAERDRIGIKTRTKALQNDETLSRLSLDEKQELLNAATGVFDTDKHVKAIGEEQNRKITKMLNDTSGYLSIDKKLRAQIRKYVNKGKVDEALAFVNSLTGLDPEKKEALAIEVEKAAKTVGAAKNLGNDNSEMKNRLQSIIKDKGFVYNFDKLSKNKKQQELFIKGLENEIKSENDLDKDQTPEEKIEDNTSKMLDQLMKLNENFEKWMTPTHDQVFDEVLQERVPEVTGKVSNKVANKAFKLDERNNIKNKKKDLSNEKNFNELVQAYIAQGYSVKQATRIVEEIADKQINGSAFKKFRTSYKATIKGTLNWRKNSKDRYKELLAESMPGYYGFDEDGNFNKHNKKSALGFRLAKIGLGAKAAVQTAKYSYTSAGWPIKLKTGADGQEQVDMSDSRTVKHIQEEEKKQEEQKSMFTSMKDAVTGLFGRFRRKDKEEEKEKKKKGGGLLSSLWQLFLGKGATVAAISAAASTGLMGLGLLDKLGLVDKMGDFFNNKVVPWLTDKALPAMNKLAGAAVSLMIKGTEVLFAKVLPNVLKLSLQNMPKALSAIATGIVDGVSSVGKDIVKGFRGEKNPDDTYQVADNKNTESTASIDPFSGVSSNINTTMDGVTLKYNVDSAINGATTTATDYSLATGTSTTSSSSKSTATTPTSSVTTETVKGVPQSTNTSGSLPTAMANANSAVQKKVASQYDSIKNNTVTINGNQMTIAQMLNSNEVVGTVYDKDGQLIEVHGNELLKYPKLAAQYGIDSTLTDEERTAQTSAMGVVTDNERKKVKLATMPIKAMLRPKAAKTAANILKTTGKVTSTALRIPTLGINNTLAKTTKSVFNTGAKGIEGASKIPELLKKAGGIENVVTGLGDNFGDAATNMMEELSQAATKSADDVASSKAAKGLIGKAADAAKSKMGKIAEKAANNSNKTVIGKFVAAIPEKISGLMSNNKVFKAFQKAAGTVGNALSEETYNALIKKLGEKIAAKLSETALASAGKAVAKITAAIGSAGVFTVASAVVGFISGYRNANSILGLTEQPSIPIRCACGLAQALNEVFCLGLIPLDLLFEIIYSILKQVLGLEDSDFEKARKAAADEVAQYNAEHGTNLTIEEYNKKDRLWSKAKSAIKSKLFKKETEVSNDFDKELDEETGETAYTAIDGIDSTTGTKKSSSKTTKVTTVTTTSPVTSALAAASGSGLPTFISQNNPRYANKRFNIAGDTQNQTLGDTGCAPASAAMAVNLVAGRGLTMGQAANDAIKYKKQNDGVTPDYFADEFSRNGLQSAYINNDSNKNSKIRSLVNRNNPVVLMGKDASNTSKANSPFGSNAHYVVATGISNDGNTIYINDPEANHGNIPYSANRILNSTRLGIAALGGKGTKLPKNLRNVLKGISGRGTYGSDTIQYKVWTRLIGAGLSEYATAGVMGSIEVESGFNPAIIEKGNNNAGYGLCQWSYGRRTQLEAFAAARNASPSDPELQIDFLLCEITKGSSDPNAHYNLQRNSKTDDGQTYTPDMWLNATDLNTAARAFCWTFERPSIKYAHIDRRVAAAQKYYQEFTGTPGTLGSGNYSAAETYNSDSTTSATTTNVASSSSESSESGNVFTRLLSAVGDMTSALFGGKPSSTTASTDATSSASTLSTGDAEYANIDTSNVTGNVSSNPTYAAKQKALVAAMKSIEGKLQYSQSGPRNPDQGSADCSSTVRWAYQKVLGVNPGDTTKLEHTDTDTYTVANSLADESKLQLGDLLLKNGHVEMYAGNGKMIGHGGGANGNTPGPTLKPLSTNPAYDTVRRWVGFKNDAQQVSPNSASNAIAASGSGLDMPTFEHTNPLQTSTVTNTTNIPQPVTTPTSVPSTQIASSNSVDLLKSLIQSVSQIASNTALLSQVITLLIKITELSSASGNASSANATEIANTKSVLVNILSDQSKQANTVNLQSLIQQVEGLTAQ